MREIQAYSRTQGFQLFQNRYEIKPTLSRKEKTDAKKQYICEEERVISTKLFNLLKSSQ